MARIIGSFATWHLAVIAVAGVLAIGIGTVHASPAPPIEANAQASPLRVSLDGITYHEATHPDTAVLRKGSDVTFYLKWNKKPRNDRPVFLKLSPVGWSGGKKAVRNRGITYSTQHLTFTADNWEEAQAVTITYPDSKKWHRDLEMRLVHKVGSNWKGTLAYVDVTTQR